MIKVDYRGRIKVLTNSTASFTDGTAIVSGRDKTQVAGLELSKYYSGAKLDRS